jgi:hypothetical protein
MNIHFIQNRDQLLAPLNMVLDVVFHKVAENFMTS